MYSTLECKHTEFLNIVCYVEVRILLQGISVDYGYDVKGYLLVFLGDTPASGLVGGFKEGVGGAYRCCRTCMIKSSELCSKVNQAKIIAIITNIIGIA